jgi:hypothetical protein
VLVLILAVFDATGCNAIFGSFDKVDDTSDPRDTSDPSDSIADVSTSDAGMDGASEVSVDTTSAESDAENASEAGDTGCVLHPHYDPMYGKKWDSCLPSGVPGDPTTYSAALLDEEFLHVEASAPAGYTFGARTPVVCGSETCIARSYTGPAITGTAWSTWCITGASAGWFVGANISVDPMCPSSDAGNWR